MIKTFAVIVVCLRVYLLFALKSLFFAAQYAAIRDINLSSFIEIYRQVRGGI